MLLLVCAGTAFGEPKDWGRPWDKSVQLEILASNHPYTENYHATLKNGNYDGYAIDFVIIPRMQDDGNAHLKTGVKLFAPIDGTIICSNFYEELLDPHNKESCKTGHSVSRDYAKADGHHIIINPDDGG